MYPVLLELGLLKVYSYGLMVALAFIVATLLARIEAQRQGVSGEKITNLSLVVAISGILGARIFYILLNLKFYSRFPVQMFMLHKGGLSFYGGFALAIICAVIFLRKQNEPLLKTFDLICPYLALGQAIGRMGCFLNGCCYGKPTVSALAVYFPGEAVGRHPTQIYSALILVLIFVILRVLQSEKTEKANSAGRLFLLYCLLYSLFRFLVEYLRGDNLQVVANLTVHQLISLGIFIVSLVIWLKNGKIQLQGCRRR